MTDYKFRCFPRWSLGSGGGGGGVISPPPPPMVCGHSHPFLCFQCSVCLRSVKAPATSVWGCTAPACPHALVSIRTPSPVRRMEGLLHAPEAGPPQMSGGLTHRLRPRPCLRTAAPPPGLGWGLGWGGVGHGLFRVACARSRPPSLPDTTEHESPECPVTRTSFNWEKKKKKLVCPVVSKLCTLWPSQFPSFSPVLLTAASPQIFFQV